jgi:hypothetical protein
MTDTTPLKMMMSIKEREIARHANHISLHYQSVHAALRLHMTAWPPEPMTTYYCQTIN